MPQISRKYPGKSAGEIYQRVDEVMQRIAEKLSLDYRRDGEKRAGEVSRMGIRGAYRVNDGEVVVDLRFPVLLPGSLRQRVQDDIERRLDELFGADTMAT